MTGSLFFAAIAKFLLGAALTAALIFLPAGTTAFFGGRLLMVILFVPMFLAGIVMMVRNPELLKKRLRARETEGEQQAVIRLSGLMFVAGFVLSGLSFRFGWIAFPRWAQLTGAAVFLIAYGLYGEVLRENAYLSRTIEVQENQQVVSTGLYGVVRHPMYAVTLLLFLAIPVVLGAPAALPVFLGYPAILAKRIRNEGAVLEAGLPGYRDYEKKVRYRLLPFVW